ncbi:hypothetical protein HZP25_15865 [Elizabethkingia anophelis]|nr:hypothetical protein [Elizabethkingia anophelis]
MLWRFTMRNTAKMSNKTALQELQGKISNLEKLSNNISPDYPNDVKYLTGYKDALNSVRKIINESNILDKEKQQITEAWIDGRKPVYKNVPNFDLSKKGEDYFNSKYENNGTTN